VLGVIVILTSVSEVIVNLKNSSLLVDLPDNVLPQEIEPGIVVVVVVGIVVVVVVVEVVVVVVLLVVVLVVGIVVVVVVVVVGIVVVVVVVEVVVVVVGGTHSPLEQIYPMASQFFTSDHEDHSKHASSS
jgi:hypothetical protein